MQAVGAADKVYEWVKRQPEIAPPAENTGLMPAVCRGELVLRDVVFRYPARRDRVVLNGLNLTVRPGKVMALCGASGGGKSSVMVSVYERESEGHRRATHDV